jgi:large subunit ribosomal protein L6e
LSIFFLLKTGIEAGRVVILLTGPYRGRRAVVLKPLDSGLLLITGPHLINGLPLRRVHQKFIIVTSTKLDLSQVNVPEHINDKYFARPAEPHQRQSVTNAEGQSIFAPRKTPYVLTEERKKDQITIDRQISEVLKKHPERQLLVPYLASHFFLKNRQHPHQMKF